MKLKIIKCSNPFSWYKDAVGEEISYYHIDSQNRALVSARIVNRYDKEYSGFPFEDADGFINNGDYELLTNK